MSGQSASFFVNERYIKHKSEDRITGRAELAYYAIRAIPKNDCWVISCYGNTNSENRIDPNYAQERIYCTQTDTPKLTSPCTRKPSEGLFKHYHSEYEEWIEWESDTTLLLRRCGWAKRVNRFILVDANEYFQK